MSGPLRPWRRLVVTALVAVSLLGAHALLHGWFADSGVAATLLSGGGGADSGTLAGALLFVALRLAVYLVLPVWLLHRLLRLGCDLVSARRRG